MLQCCEIPNNADSSMGHRTALLSGLGWNRSTERRRRPGLEQSTRLSQSCWARGSRCVLLTHVMTLVLMLFSVI